MKFIFKAEVFCLLVFEYFCIFVTSFNNKKIIMSKHSKIYNRLYGSKSVTTQINPTATINEKKPLFKLNDEQVKHFNLLPNDYSVNYDYFYLADGVLVRSDVKGTISTLKKDLISLGKSANEIRTVDLQLYLKLKQSEI